MICVVFMSIFSRPFSKQLYIIFLCVVLRCAVLCCAVPCYELLWADPLCCTPHRIHPCFIFNTETVLREFYTNVSCLCVRACMCCSLLRSFIVLVIWVQSYNKTQHSVLLADWLGSLAGWLFGRCVLVQFLVRVSNIGCGNTLCTFKFFFSFRFIVLLLLLFLHFQYFIFFLFKSIFVVAVGLMLLLCLLAVHSVRTVDRINNATNQPVSQPAIQRCDVSVFVDVDEGERCGARGVHSEPSECHDSWHDGSNGDEQRRFVGNGPYKRRTYMYNMYSERCVRVRFYFVFGFAFKTEYTGKNVVCRMTAISDFI